jgi:hypothetical protein
VLPTITEMVIMFLLLDDGFYRSVDEATPGSDSILSTRLLRRELTFGLKPVFQFTARLCPASEIKFVDATPDFALTPGHTEHDLAV